MRSKIIALASAVALAGAVTMVASTGATALRLPDDVYYYSNVTRAFGHTPRHDRLCAGRGPMPVRWPIVPAVSGPTTPRPVPISTVTASLVRARERAGVCRRRPGL